jgi:hypothetical protein
MNEFIWVQALGLDAKGEWLKVIKSIGDDEILCERKDPYKVDVIIDKTDIIKRTFDEIF